MNLRLALALVACLVLSTHGFHATFADHERTKCFEEEWDDNTFVTGSFAFNAEGVDRERAHFYQLSFRVENEGTHEVLFKRDDDFDGRFAFTTHAAGKYSICAIMNPLETNQKRTFELVLSSGETATDYKSMASKDRLDPLNAELRVIENNLVAVLTDIFGLKFREERHRQTTDSTATRVYWFPLSGMILTVTIAAYQTFYVRRFFKNKKMF